MDEREIATPVCRCDSSRAISTLVSAERYLTTTQTAPGISGEIEGS